MLAAHIQTKLVGFIQHIADKKFNESIVLLKEKNILPAICGRVCPQEIQCEGLCIVGKRGEPVAIGNLERFVADWERENGTGDLPPTLQTAEVSGTLPRVSLADAVTRFERDMIADARDELRREFGDDTLRV